LINLPAIFEEPTELRSPSITMKKTASLPLVKNPLKYMEETLYKMENHPQIVEKSLTKNLAEKSPSNTLEKSQPTLGKCTHITITEQQNCEEIKIKKIGKFLTITLL
jgi:hypothetical protein